MRVTVLGLVIIFMASVLNAAAQDGDILALYSFEKGDPEDTKGKNDDLTLFGNPKPVAGKVGGALQFDGEEDFIELSIQADLEGFLHGPFQERTFTMFFKADDVEGEHTLFDEGAHQNGMIVAIMAKELQVGTMDSSVQFTIAVPFDDTSNWHHVAGVFDNGEVLLYLDGQKVAEGTAPFEQISGHGDESGLAATADGDAFGTVGTNPGPPKKFFKGILDEVTIYTKALTAIEILSLAAKLPVETQDSLGITWGHIKADY